MEPQAPQQNQIPETPSTPPIIPPVTPVTASTPPVTLSPAPHTSTWSWGGFMFDPLVILASKKYVMLLIYLLYLIPILNLIAIIATKIYIGLHARALIETSPAFANPDEARGFMKGIDHAGWILFLIGLVAAGIAFLVAIVGGFALLTFFQKVSPQMFN